MITLSSADINIWIASLLWPLARILGLITAAPVLGNRSVPTTVKVSLGVLLALVIAPTVPKLPATDPMSYAGLLILVQEMLIGVAMGFTMRIVFSSIEMAGEISSLTMGLGFASFFDPNTQGRSSAISQFLALVATMAFISINAHLVLLSALAESFQTLPVSGIPINGGGFKRVADWGARIFSAGLQLSLPIVAALLITNVALGVLTRAAPQLNLFGIGFPITLGIGFIVVATTLPYLGTPLENLFLQGVEKVREFPRIWVAREPQPASRTAPPAAPALNQTPPAVAQ
ncbi:flagellar biosynthetic protein FliR [Duganella sp. FT92W]|uniref:Flagellar biosynthetic protein FliR n=1 Tax=Pseudoduganella rivuli TaxID=2666085 RepID=A0A7X2LS27_9BURK|nr:flagellar biosynthetic protein FliR [Pseudoduganella rivuli]MRV71433.1 flagellar biosynthetic protein FliR [Pseudoduganella rivuli]